MKGKTFAIMPRKRHYRGRLAHLCPKVNGIEQANVIVSAKLKVNGVNVLIGRRRLLPRAAPMG